MPWEDLSYVLGSSLSLKILECLSHGEKAPSTIAKETDIARSNVSTKIPELVKRGLIKCLNPLNRRWRFYAITDKGKRIFGKAQKIKKS